MVTLNIITPLSRPKNLLALYKDLRKEVNSNSICIKWWIIFDKKIDSYTFSFWKKRFEYNEEENFKIYTFLSHLEKPIAGHAHRNLVLNYLETKIEYFGEWVYQLDDDNTIHPLLISYLIENNEKLKLHSGLIFSQQLKEGQIRLEAKKESVKVCHIDMAMFLYRLGDFNNERFIETDYCADGHFIEGIFNKNPDKFYIESKVLCYYNYQN